MDTELGPTLDLYDLLDDIGISLTPGENSSPPKAANKQHFLSAANARDPKSGRTLLHEAAMQGDESNIDQLIRDGADVTKRTFLGRNTALHLASEHGNTSAVKALLAPQETNPNAQNKYMYRETPLHLAQSTAVADLLIAKGASLDSRDIDNHTPLEAMCKREESDDNKHLIQHLAKLVEQRTRAEIRKELDANRERRRRAEAITAEQKRLEDEEETRSFNNKLLSQYRRWRGS